ncbi:MAG TPA: hypothetical protein VGG94_01890 [Chthoniobacterales bacterium]|jgi:hypothetical protein
MTSHLIRRRLLRAGGFFLIGDGLLGLVRPRKSLLLSRFSPELTRAVAEELTEYPRLSRSIQIAKVAVGLALAISQVSEDVS